MSRPYALCMLLEHGALTRGELITVTGWPKRAVDSALRRSLRRQWVRRDNRQRRTTGGAPGYAYELETRA